MTSSRWLLICLTTLGCGHPAEGPSAPILRGRWGASGESPAQLTGLGVGAELQLSCSSVGTDNPVEIAPDSTFTFTGEYTGSMATTERPRARVSGRWQGDLVTVDLDVLGDDLPASSYSLERGVDPHFEDQPPICPQPAA